MGAKVHRRVKHVFVGVNREKDQADGQTARATVVTQQLDNVLSVPNVAVRRLGDRSEVTVVGPNGEQRPVTFQPGVVGAERTQVLSGLFDGQEVVLPSGR